MAAAVQFIGVPYVLVVGAGNFVPANLSEEDAISQALHFIGFRTEMQRNAVRNDAFTSWNDIKLLTVNDISSMAKSFAGRTNNNGRIIFGTIRSKLLKAFVYWVQDFHRTSEQPSMQGLDEPTFKAALQGALTRDRVRENLKEQTSSAAKAADPGALMKEAQWKDWEEKFTNYISAHIAVAGVPLSYVIREKENPNDNEIPDDADFVTKTILKAPLEGEEYAADKLSVFNFIVSFTTGHPSGDWVKNTLRYSDGRRSMQALRDHFAGEGNASRRIAEADRLQKHLHYKSEKAMSFETFLTQCQKMYHIYETEGDPWKEDKKIRFLFNKAEHKGLEVAIEALKMRQTMGEEVTYTTCANHLATVVSEFPDYISRNRKVAAVGRNDDAPSIYNADGSINTDRIDNWSKIPYSEKKKVFAERKRLGIKFNPKDGSSKPSNSAKSADKNTIEQLKKVKENLKRKIKALKKKQGISDDDENEGEDEDAGDQFGGKSKKKKSKKKEGD